MLYIYVEIDVTKSQYSVQLLDSAHRIAVTMVTLSNQSNSEVLCSRTARVCLFECDITFIVRTVLAIKSRLSPV